MELAIISIIISSIISFLIGRYFYNSKRKTHEKIEELKANVEYLEKIRTKPIELIRHAFSKIFLILFLLSLSLFIPIFFEFVSNNQKLDVSQSIINMIQFLTMLACVASCYWTFKTFSDVVNYDTAVKKHQKQIDKLSKKIEHS
jgi:cell division protein FtsB